MEHIIWSIFYGPYDIDRIILIIEHRTSNMDSIICGLFDLHPIIMLLYPGVLFLLRSYFESKLEKNQKFELLKCKVKSDLGT